MPLRILHLTNATEAGGLSQYLLDLCAGLHQRGIDVAVGGSPGAWHRKFTSAPWPWFYLPLSAGQPDGMPLGSAVQDLRRHLEAHPVDVLHTHYRRATWIARRAARKMNIPILYTLHLSGIPIRGWRRWFSDFGDHAHAPSADARRWLIEEARYPADRITLIPHGIDAVKFPHRDAAAKSAARAALGISDSALVAVFAARLDVPKNPEWMVDLADASRSALPDLLILMAGAGPNYTPLKADIEKRNLGSRIRLLGEQEVLPIYQAADALLLPSLREGFGLVCAEAMCTGIPVLRTFTSGTQELIVEGVTGSAVSIDREAFIAGAIKFLSDRPGLERMGDAAAVHIRKNFPLEKQIESTIELYKSLKR
jgi:glycosyltransferase involved in cell wall biosynthesis